MTDAFLTTDEAVQLVRLEHTKHPGKNFRQWAHANGIIPAKRGRICLWPKARVLDALYADRAPRRRAPIRVA